ncbi:YqaE/Pmp3 family membrane protein [Jeotgalibacillus proteolyticus]|uniref:YqaE/Pmp3 family membrane protein n=1 Tax=Jeotgalibacillus proteolyticus TaxID=2082395 RepID=A0A2S5GDZ9_9BACL|nr:YqaE/Pmp3 family membrane protein [Jeotgalibacillus proteolyticus]PPA71134.1 YqaE/Pmp3 family membrane protein [Jeotgalibacillus proteolyticus]
MLYILAIFLPPVAVLFTGRFGSFLLNILLTILGYIPGLIHAIIVVRDQKHKKDMENLLSKRS